MSGFIFKQAMVQKVAGPTLLGMVWVWDYNQFFTTEIQALNEV